MPTRTVCQPSQTRLRFDALAALVDPRPAPANGGGGRDTYVDNRVTFIAERLGLPRERVQRWKRDGVPYWRADWAATRLGLHPANVWPEWYELEPKVKRERIS